MFPTINQPFAFPNKLGELALRYIFPSQGRKLNLEQNIFDLADI